MHKVERNEEENKGNIFVEGIRGWKWLFSKMKGKKKEPEVSSQPQTPQPQQVTQNGS